MVGLFNHAYFIRVYTKLKDEYAFRTVWKFGIVLLLSANI